TDGNALTLGTLATGDLTAISTGTLDLGKGTITGNLVANSNTNAIQQTAGLTVTGTSSITATGNTITLNDLNNDCGLAVSTTGNATALRDKNGIILGTNSATTFDVTAGGTITQTGTVTATGASKFNAGANAITLDKNNDFQAAVDLTG